MPNGMASRRPTSFSRPFSARWAWRSACPSRAPSTHSSGAAVAWRVFALIAIGWAWQMLARPSIEMFRVFGVLPRLGLCFGLAATIAILTARRAPDGKARLNPARDPHRPRRPAARLLGGDGARRRLHARRQSRRLDRSRDRRREPYVAGWAVMPPEMSSTIPRACSRPCRPPPTCCSACSPRSPGSARRGRATLWIALAGVALALLGLALAPAFPINKKLWTSSYVLLSTGLSALLFAGCVVATRSEEVRRALRPFDIFGMNAILAYVVSLLIGLAGMRLGFQATGFAAIDGVHPRPLSRVVPLCVDGAAHRAGLADPAAPARHPSPPVTGAGANALPAIFPRATSSQSWSRTPTSTISTACRFRRRARSASPLRRRRHRWRPSCGPSSDGAARAASVLPGAQ